MSRRIDRSSVLYRAKFAAGLVLATVGACAQMRQNLRNEFVSYRGAWFCKKEGCDDGGMRRSTKAHREGELTVNHGKLTAGAALVFNAGKPPQSMRATVRDCHGTVAEVPAAKVRAPGKHGITEHRDSYVVRVDPGDYAELELGRACKQWVVTTYATWDRGTQWEQRAGIALE